MLLSLPRKQFTPLTRTCADARQVLDLPPTGRLLGILSHFDEGKGQDFVIEVLHYLRSQLGYNTSLVIMGEPTRNEGDTYLRQLHR